MKKTQFPKPVKAQTITAAPDYPKYTGETYQFTLTPMAHDAVLVSWKNTPWSEEKFYTIQQNSTDRVNRPTYKPWKRALAKDLETAAEHFLGRWMVDKSDTLARYENLENAWTLPTAVRIAACRLIIRYHNAVLREAAYYRQTCAAWKALKPYILDKMKYYQTDFTHHDALILGRYNPKYTFIVVSESHTFTENEINGLKHFTNKYTTPITAEDSTIDAAMKSYYPGDRTTEFYLLINDENDPTTPLVIALPTKTTVRTALETIYRAHKQRNP